MKIPWHRIRRSLTAGKLRHWVKSPISFILPFLIAAYFITLDVWGDDLDWIKDYKQLHFYAFLVLLIVEFLIRLLSFVSDKFSESESVVRSGETLKEFVKTISKVVLAKRQRFRTSLDRIGKKNSSPFEILTQPEHQIREVFNQAGDFLTRIGVKYEQLDATVIRQNPESKNWDYLCWGNDNLKRQSADIILNQVSTAKRAVETGSRQFFPSKRTANEKSCYSYDEFDKRTDNVGSIFCQPVHIPMPDHVNESFVVSFSTYGVEICDTLDKESIEATEFLFAEFAKRIELELLLYSIKAYKRRQTTANKRTKSKRSKSNESDQ
jgi:hypothetical protein